jgi:predicted amidohydrolase
MTTLKLTITQLNSETPDALHHDWAALCEHTAAHRPDLVLLPEMPFFRWLPATPRFNPYQWRESMTVHDEWVLRLPELNAAAVALTIPTWPDDGLRQNVGVLWTAETGTVQPLHAKVFLPEEAGVWEQTWYMPGPAEFAPAQCGPACIGFTICSEIWFPSAADRYGQQGAQVLLSPRATEGATFGKWQAAGITNAVISGAFHASSNRAGATAAGSAFGGGGWLIDPDGAVLAVTSEDTPFITTPLTLAQADTDRARYPRYIPR